MSFGSKRPKLRFLAGGITCLLASCDAGTPQTVRGDRTMKFVGFKNDRVCLLDEGFAAGPLPRLPGGGVTSNNACYVAVGTGWKDVPIGSCVETRLRGIMIKFPDSTAEPIEVLDRKCTMSDKDANVTTEELMASPKANGW
jgi:hypothetical protein